MKILITTGIYEPEIGGPATYLKEFVPELKKQGFKVKVLTFGKKRLGAITVSRFWPFPLRFFLFFLRTLIHGRKTDVIFNTDTFSAGFPAALANFFMRKHFVTRFVGDAAWEISRANNWTDDTFVKFQKKSYGFRTGFIRLAQKFVLKRSEIITVSNFLKKMLVNWGINKEKITVIYNEAKPEKLPSRAHLRRKFNARTDFILLSVGRLVDYKGVDGIIKMFHRLKGNMQLWIVGSGPDEDKLKKLVHKLNETRIRFFGPQNKKITHSLMKAADTLILNSEYEGMPFTALEAMVNGLPVVASNVCGTPEVVVHNKTGLLFKQNNIYDMRRQVQKLVVDNQLRSFITENAYKNLPKNGIKKAIQILKNENKLVDDWH